MKKNKLFSIFCVIAVVAWLVVIIKQQLNLNDCQKEIDTISASIESAETTLAENKQNLKEEQKNANSKEYIEKLAREKLSMYLPNERVYVDNNK